MAALIDIPSELQQLPPASSDIQEMAQSGVAQHEEATVALKAAMKPELFKEPVFRGPGGNKPLEDPHEINAYATKATLDVRVASAQGYRNRSSVVKSMNPVFLAKYGALKAALERPSIGDQLQAFMGAVANPDTVRSFTAGNIGLNSIYGLTPSLGGFAE